MNKEFKLNFITFDKRNYIYIKYIYKMKVFFSILNLKQDT